MHEHVTPIEARAAAVRVARIAAAAALVCSAAIAPRPVQQAEPRVVEIVARRFAFEPSQVEVAVGERITLSIRSADGVHGVEIKQLKVKREVPRGGKPVTIDMTPTEPGRFPILCSEYCGDGHEDMKGLLVVNATDVAQR
jgi:cytochrome c oxidase subunit 2